MNKLKIYLDTNVISCLDAPETPERMIVSRRFWDGAKKGEYDIYFSRTTMDEIDKCPEPKRSFMLIELAGIEFILCDIDKNNASVLAEKYIESGGLPPRSKDDAMHIAYATLAKCDVIASWNFKHVMNIRAMTAVEKVNAELGYDRLGIYSPQSLIKFEEDSEDE